MNSFEKVQNCFDLKKPTDRKDIPVYPMMLLYPGKVAGFTQQEICEDPQKWLKALEITFDKVGYPDLCQGNPPGDVLFLHGLEPLRPGHELGPDESYQLRESRRMEIEDYKDIVENGYLQWYNRYLCTIQKPPMTPQEMGARWGLVGQNAQLVGQWLGQHGIAPVHGTASGVPFDTLAMVRSFTDFCYDLFDEPDLVKAAMAKGTPEVLGNILGTLQYSPIKRASLYAMRSDANSISPDIWKEFVWPELKKLIMGLVDADVQVVLHADGNWLPMLSSLTEIPKGKMLVELDGVTDIEKAYDILQGCQAIKGDVPATLMAFGTPDEVHEYMEKLINMAMKGGFMVGSGCEIPLNCKLENLQAMMDAVRK